MVLNAGLFVFSFYRLLYKTQAHEKLRVSSPGALRVVLLTVPDRNEYCFPVIDPRGSSMNVSWPSYVLAEKPKGRTVRTEASCGRSYHRALRVLCIR